MRGELLPSEDTIDDRSEAWSVLLGSAHPLLTAMGGGVLGLKTHLARLERHGEQLTKIGGAGSYHHPGCGGGAPRLARWRAPDRWAGEAAKAGSSRSRFVRSIPDRTAKKPEFDEGCGGGRISSTTCNRGIWRIHFHHYVEAVGGVLIITLSRGHHSPLVILHTLRWSPPKVPPW